MAKVPLDGLRIEVPHSASPEDVARRLEEFANDLAQNKFSDWGVTVSRAGHALQLTGRRNGTHFDADVTSQDGVAVITLKGSIELNRIKLGLAGGTKGVRGRVQAQLRDTLQQHLA